MARILLMGDVAPTGTAAKPRVEFGTGGAVMIVANLETPLTSAAEPRPKSGPALRAEQDALDAFADERFVFCIANNHMMDYAEEGLADTIAACRSRSASVVGGGTSSKAAFEPIQVEADGIRIAVLARAERQFGVASNTRCGVAPVDPVGTCAAIRKLSGDVDHVIVSVHGGPELSPWPTPQWQDMLRGFVDAGATIVHGHHAHVPQGYEEYKGGLILYGLGNFVADPERWRDRPNAMWSVVIDAVLSADRIEKWAVRTSVMDERDSNELRVRESDAGENDAHRAYLVSANTPLNDRLLLEALWQETAVRLYRKWFAEYLGFERVVRPARVSRQIRCLAGTLLARLRGKQLGFRDTPSREEMLLWYHLFACETHRDTVGTALGVLSGELEDLRSGETQQLADELLPWSRGINDAVRK